MTDTVNVPLGFGVDDLAQEIRRVDGENDLGAGALAEALMPFIRHDPASDELLEALEPDFLAACAAAVADEYPATSQSLHYYALKQSDLIAKHKGPQS